MQSIRLTSRQHVLLALSAFALLAVMGMLQCASLSVDNATSSALELLVGGLALLCASMLIEDVVGDRLRNVARRALARGWVAYKVGNPGKTASLRAPAA